MGRFDDMIQQEQNVAEKRRVESEKALDLERVAAANRQAADEQLIRAVVRPLYEEAKSDLIANGIDAAIMFPSTHSIHQSVDLVVGPTVEGSGSAIRRTSRVATFIKDGKISIEVSGGRPVLPPRKHGATVQDVADKLAMAIQDAVKSYLGNLPPSPGVR